jgi:hypothetical protein
MRLRARTLLTAAMLTGIAVTATASRASAVPAFAMQTGLQCDACHNSPRQLNELGDAYARNGYRLGNLGAGKKPVVALRGALAYSGDPDSSGLPKATVDEVEVFVAARVTPQLSAAAQFYLIDGGRNGSTREAWLQYTSRGDVGGAPLRLTAGSITLPLPVDPETSRQTSEHYAIFDQVVGANPFAFIDPRNAVSLGLGNLVDGPSVAFVAAQGHDPHSGLPATGTDHMVQAQEAWRGITLSAYDYAGRRELGAVPDDFRRHGIGLNVYRGRFAFENAIQTGYDSSPNGDGIGIASSGGYTQVRYQLPHGTFLLARYDGVSDTGGAGFARSLTVGASRALGRSLRLEIEDVIAHGERTTNTLNASLAFGVSNSRFGSGSY